MKDLIDSIVCMLTVLVLLFSFPAAYGNPNDTRPRSITTSYIQEAVCDLTGAQYSSVDAIAVGDVDNDGTDEMVANYAWYSPGGGTPATVILSWNGSAYVIENSIDGFAMMVSSMMAMGCFHIVIGDADNDGLNELLMPGSLGGVAGVYLFKYDRTGYRELWSALSNTYQDAEICDVDGDGLNEVLVTGLGVLRWDGKAMTTICGLPPSEGVRVGDTDGDGRYEVVLATGSLGIDVYGWNGSGLVLKGSTSADGFISCGFGIGDSDSDGKQECWRAEYHNSLVVWGYNGSGYVAEWKGTAPNGDNAVTAWSGDPDDDGVTEDFIGNGNYAYGNSVLQYEWGDGTYTSTWNSGQLNMYCHSIAIGDADGDGYSELVAGTGSCGRFYVFEARPKGTPLLKVKAVPDSDTVNYGENVTFDITVRSNGSVEGADISMQSSLGGEFGPVEELGNGTFRASFTAIPDKMGNVTRITVTASKAGYRPGSDSVQIRIVDTIPPVIKITYPADGSVLAKKSIEVTGTARDNMEVGSVEISQNSGDWKRCHGTISWNSSLKLDEGSNLICARAIDDAGNIGQTSVNVTFDPTPPSIKILSPSEGAVITQTMFNVTGTASDNNALGKVEVCLDGADWLLCDKTAEWTSIVALSPGRNRILARATDLAGNSRVAMVNVTADFTSPTIRISVPAPGAMILSSPVQVEGDAGDDAGIATVVLNCNDGPWGPCAGTFTWSGNISVASGPNRVSARATDVAGRSSMASVELIADLATPSIAITSPVDRALSDSPSMHVRGTASDDAGVARVELSSGGLAWVVCNGTYSWDGELMLAEGKNQFRARATDLGGRTAEAIVNVTVDTTPPVLVVTRPPGGWTSSTFDVTVTGTASDDTGIARVELSTDGVGWAICAGTTRWGGSVKLTANAGVIRVRAFDLCGNVAEKSINVSVDTTLPVVVIIRPADESLVYFPRVTVAGTASDDKGVVKVEISRDGRNWTLCNGNENWSGALTLREGNNTIYARATDTDGKTQVAWVNVRLISEKTVVSGLPFCFPAGLIVLATSIVMFLLWLIGRRDRLHPKDPPT